MKRYEYLKILYTVLISLVFCLVSVEKAECADDTCGGYSNTCSCGASNPYYCSPNKCGNCTWWAWYKACCEWGIGLPGWGNAIDWWQQAKDGNFPTGNTPRANSIFVAHWEGTVDGVWKDWGHVGWVTKVYSDGSFDTIEQAWGGWSGTCGPKNFYGNTIDHLKSIGNPVIGFIYGDFLTYITPDTEKVYWIQNNKKYLVKDEGVLNAMQNEGIPGWSWSRIYTVSKSYDSGPDFIASDSTSNGLLVRQTETDPVYLIVEGKRRWITSQEALNWKGTDWNADVIEVSSNVISSYVPTQGIDLYGLGEGETDPSVKNSIISVYTRNEDDPYCASSSDRKGWPGKFSQCLGFPTTTVGTAYVSGYSGIQGKYQQFDYTDTTLGAINWTSQYGAFEFHGAIGKSYSNVGFSSSCLGFPISDEYQSGSYRRSDFEGGYIEWNPSINQTSVVCGSTSETVTVPSIPSGPENGAVGTGYTYSTGGSTSTEGHPVQYFFDWGDGTNSGWLPVGQTSAVKSWASNGIYLVQAQARCSIDTSVSSSWSGLLLVEITASETGTLSVTTTPVSGDIYVDSLYKGTGSWSGFASVGSHTVSFGSVSGYNTPSPEVVTIYASQTTSVTGTYTPASGEIITLATGLSYPNDIALDSNSVYWCELGGGAVKKMSKGGGSVTTLVSGLYSVSSLALDNNYVYIAENYAIDAANIKKVPKNGGTVETIVSGQPSTSSVATDGSSVYWTDAYGGSIRKVPINGGSVSILASGSSSPLGIAVDSTSVYWTEFTNPGAIKKVSVGGGSVLTLANNSNTPGIAVDGSNVYWTEYVSSNDAKVNKVSINGGATTSLASGLKQPWTITTDNTNVYWVEYLTNGFVMQTPINGGPILTLASGVASPIAIAVDDTFVYWLESGSGLLKKVAKGTGTVTRTLTIACSIPHSGVPITVTPNDNYGRGNGTTEFKRIYDNNAIVTLTAPATREGNLFQKWQRNGLDYSVDLTTTVTINDDYTMTAIYAPVGALQLSSGSYSVNENGGMVLITVTRTGGSSGAVGISYATSNGTATAGSDFALTSGTLSWADGDAANKTFSVPITNDTLNEPSETLAVTLSSPTGGATLGTPASATVTITDDDLMPTVQFSAASSSGSEAMTPVLLTVTLSSASAQTVAVDYATADGTATAGSDYTAANGTLTFNPGVVNQAISVPIINDTVVEGSETFMVTLSGPVNGTLGTTATHTYTISNDDNAGTIQFSSATYSVKESGGSILITVTRTGGSNGAVEVSYATSNGTAEAGVDYTSMSGTLGWADGDTANKTFSVPILDDIIYELNETVNLFLNLPSGGATLGSLSTAVLNIFDNNPSLVDLDGDQKTDIAVWRPGDGYWYTISSRDGSILSQQWGSGALNDVPVAGDYDGDGKTDCAVLRPGEYAYWYILKSSDGEVIAEQWGSSTLDDKPVPGDYDGDGKTDIAVWRPGEGFWYIINSKDGSITATQWGAGYAPYNDVPVPGDYDGDGKTDIAIWRAADGYWYIVNSKDQSVTATQWGSNGLNDVLVPGDYDGDGKTDVAVWRPNEGFWYIISSRDGSIISEQWGAGYDPYNDVPVPGDYDGDGKTDIAIWRSSDGYWYILKFSDGEVISQQWGWGLDPINDEPISQ